jgi:uncharacterized protein (DUF2141 family)
VQKKRKKTNKKETDPNLIFELNKQKDRIKFLESQIDTAEELNHKMTLEINNLKNEIGSNNKDILKINTLENEIKDSKSLIVKQENIISVSQESINKLNLYIENLKNQQNQLEC